MIRQFLVSVLLFNSILGVNQVLAQEAQTSYKIEYVSNSVSNSLINIYFDNISDKDKVVVFDKIQTINNVEKLFWADSNKLIIESSDTRVSNIINGIFMEYGYKLIIQ